MSKLDPSSVISRVIVAHYADGVEFVAGIGKVVAYCDAPTFVIERSDGTQFSWRADMCRHPNMDELEAELLDAMKKGATEGRCPHEGARVAGVCVRCQQPVGES